MWIPVVCGQTIFPSSYRAVNAEQSTFISRFSPKLHIFLGTNSI